jgi:hypothetical protein
MNVEESAVAVPCGRDNVIDSKERAALCDGIGAKYSENSNLRLHTAHIYHLQLGYNANAEVQAQNLLLHL